MSDDHEKDPQLFLPPELNADWAVVPRKSIHWLIAQSLLLGAGLALTVGSWFSAGWPWGLPVAIAIMFLIALPMRRREADAIARLPDCPNEESFSV